MDQTETPSHIDLLNELRLWSWPNLWSVMGFGVLLVADRDFLNLFVAEFGKPKCQMLTLEEAAKLRKLEKGTHTILVFAFRGERALARQMKKRFPGMRVFSAQYDLAPNSAVLPPRFPVNAKDAGAEPKPPVILLSSPGSDAEYLAHLMDQAGLPAPREYLGRPFIELMRHADPVLPLTYFRQVHRQKNVDGTTYMHLQSDVLRALAQKTILSERRLRWLLEKSGARVILVTRRDKLVQAGTLGLLGPLPARSAWTIPANRASTVSRKQVSLPGFQSSLRLVEQLRRDDAWLADLTAGLPHLHTVTLEDIARDPAAAVKGVAALIGQDVANDIDYSGYAEAFRPLKSILPAMENFAREIVDRSGLNSNGLNAALR